MQTIIQRLAALREKMQQHQLSAWIIPTADPHMSEYLPSYWQSRVYFSGFTGSAGVLVVQQDHATLWTDARYWEQAAAELAGSTINLGKQAQGGASYLTQLLTDLSAGAKVGIAPDMLSLADKHTIQTALSAKSIELWYEQDVAGEVWGNARPALPHAEVYQQNAACVPHSAAEKLARIRQAMKEHGASSHLISSLDDVAWTTNLRGSDVAFNPVFLSHLWLDADHAVLFVEPSKINEQIAAALRSDGIDIQAYEKVAAFLSTVSGSLLIDPAKVAVATLAQLPEDVALIQAGNPACQFKAEKSPQELQHIREAMRQDGIALCGFFADLEQQLAEGVRINEYDIDALLLKHRSQREHFVSHSFGTIAGFNANGAMPHYSAPEDGSLWLEGNGLLLIDSGGQYHTGTTDITRVMPIGKPTAAQIRDFTLVLKAHIALANAVFPEGIHAPMIDAICRQPLWQAQRDYGHGTGHGVGYFLNVHEPPQRISYFAPNHPMYALKEGMLTSNEPGLYRPQQWGIRIENLVVSHKVPQPEETLFGEYLYFETVTLCPIDTRLVDVRLLNEQERAWLNDYHARVRAEIEPFVSGAAKVWLLERTEAI